MYKIQGLANLTVGNLSAPNIGSKSPHLMRSVKRVL